MVINVVWQEAKNETSDGQKSSIIHYGNFGKKLKLQRPISILTRRYNFTTHT
jgi:hypothetical protein